MILVEDRLHELFNTLPEITGNVTNFKPSFGFGTYEDCVKFLAHKAKEGVKHYPLVWLETPFTRTGKENRFQFPLKLILAEKSNAEMSNLQRLDITFKPMLVPLYNNVLTALNKSGFTKILKPEKNKATNYFNFGVDGKTQATDIWDAIKFECELEMDECPLRTITY